MKHQGQLGRQLLIAYSQPLRRRRQSHNWSRVKGTSRRRRPNVGDHVRFEERTAVVVGIHYHDMVARAGDMLLCIRLRSPRWRFATS